MIFQELKVGDKFEIVSSDWIWIKTDVTNANPYNALQTFRPEYFPSYTEVFPVATIDYNYLARCLGRDTYKKIPLTEDELKADLLSISKNPDYLKLICEYLQINKVKTAEELQKDVKERLTNGR